VLNKEAYREAKDNQPEVFKWRGTEEMLEAYRRKGPCMTKEAIQYALDHPGPISSPTPKTISKGSLKRCDSFLKDKGIIVEALIIPKKPPPDSVAGAGEAITPLQPSAGTNEQMELRKEHARQIADDLYSLVDSGGKDRLFAKPWTDRYSRLRSQMRLAWEHLQSYPVALAAVEKAVAVRNKHETPNLGRELIDQVRFARLLPSLSQVLAAEKQANQAVRSVVVQLRNGATLEGTCELGY
jgi:hypothetical protein